MHSNFFFLIATPEPMQGPQLWDYSRQVFMERFDDRCDDNNYYAQMMVAGNNGVEYAPDGGTLPDYNQLLANAHRSVVMDASLYGSKNGLLDINPFSFGGPGKDQHAFELMSDAQLNQYMRVNVPKALAKGYAAAANCDPAEPSVRFDLQGWRRRRLSGLFERYAGADNCPFAADGTPYDYPAFDLTWGESLEGGAAILLTDIHT